MMNSLRDRAVPGRTVFDRTVWWRVLTAVVLLHGASFLSACSGSSSAAGGEGPGIVQPPETGTSVELPDGLQQLEDYPGLLTRIPDVLASEVRADTGLQIAYTRREQVEADSGAWIEDQWEYMQTCIAQQTVPPVIVIREERVIPFTAEDDVIFNIDGTPVASASLQALPVVQVVEADLDGSLGSAGFNLRSIMGRMLWLSAGLPERDYPFECARRS